MLSFKPRHEVSDIVTELCANRDKFGDFKDERYYNIATFKRLDGTLSEPFLKGDAPHQAVQPAAVANGAAVAAIRR